MAFTVKHGFGHNIIISVENAMRQFLSWAVLAAIVVGLHSGAVLAADPLKPEPEAVFKRLDTNSDGKLTLEEFIGKRKDEAAAKAKERFAKLDKDKDGSLTLEEFKARVGKKK